MLKTDDAAMLTLNDAQQRAPDLTVQDRIQLRPADPQLPGERHRILARGQPQIS
jgi:hypothetical protein